MRDDGNSEGELMSRRTHLQLKEDVAKKEGAVSTNSDTRLDSEQRGPHFTTMFFNSFKSTDVGL